MNATGTLMLLLASVVAADDLTVLKTDTDRTKLVQNHLAAQAHAALKQRTENYEKLKTPQQCVAYQKQLREFMLAQLGGLPKRGPLNSKVVGMLKGKDYRIEKIIYESRPRHHVTATLYLPQTKGPYPAVLIACGHTKTGKAADYNQRIGMLLAKNGLAALCYDPIGQGERSQILDESGKAAHRSSTTEHFLVGVGSILTGTNTAQYRIWDGIRGIDYLTSREDIDGKRIGCTGCSGGGTLTSYIMALDDRVACAAPACYLTTFGHLIDSIGPQDAEQNIFGQLAGGLDQPDYVLMRAPKPTLICSTTKDFFSIEGSWDTFRQAKRIYTRLGFPERVDLVEVDHNHGVTKESREALTRWMRRWLLGKDDAITEKEDVVWSVDELRCTPDGEVLKLADERSVFELNLERAEKSIPQRKITWSQRSAVEMRETIRKLARIRPTTDAPVLTSKSAGVVERDGYKIEKLVLNAKNELPIPALVFRPAEPKGDAILYLHGQGKHRDAAVGGPIEQLVQKGRLVLAIDLNGIGETSSGGANHPVGSNWKEYYLAYLLGKSFVGIRAENTLAAARFLRGLDGKQERGVQVIAIGEAGPPALHAVAVEPQLFTEATIQRSLKSWLHVVASRQPKDQLINTVHGALQHYDLTDLPRLCGDVKVSIVAPTDAEGKEIK